MYINSEKDLEDYICNNLPSFISFLKSIYGEDENIEFVGRQIVIGDSRLDLLFQTQENTQRECFEIRKTFIVVELKFRETEAKDIAQLIRYMNLLHDLEFDERIGSTEVIVRGLLLSTGLNNDVQEMQMYFSNYTNVDINFAEIKCDITYQEDSYSRKEEYIEKMTVDSRLRQTREVKSYGEKENDRP